MLGFKEFIKAAEKDRLEMLLEEDPEYYYHVLPYAQVLHVSKIWINKFKDLTVPPPTWYVGEEAWSAKDFDFIVHDIEKEIELASKAEPIAALIHRMILVIQAVTVVFHRRLKRRRQRWRRQPWLVSEYNKE